MLSERENGFKMAVNILNVGRIKLGAATIGSSRRVISQAVNYASERVQFGLPISKFGAIRYKPAEMAVRNFSVESDGYRAGQKIDDGFDAWVAGGLDAARAQLKATEQCKGTKAWWGK